MKKLFLTLIALATMCCVVCAQEYSPAQFRKMKEENVVPSKIITMQGDTIKGFLKRMIVPTPHDLGYDPNDFNNTVTRKVLEPIVQFPSKVMFISENDFLRVNISKEMYKIYTPKELKGYIYDYIGENLTFRSLKVSCANFTYNGYYFVQYVRDLTDGEVFYEYYFPFEGNEGLEPHDLESFTHAHHALYEPSKNRVILVEDEKPENFYEKRCPQIVERWKNDQYTNVSGKKGSKLNKWAKLAAKVDQSSQDKAREKAFEDYVNTCVDKR